MKQQQFRKAADIQIRRAGGGFLPELRKGYRSSLFTIHTDGFWWILSVQGAAILQAVWLQNAKAAASEFAAVAEVDWTVPVDKLLSRFGADPDLSRRLKAIVDKYRTTEKVRAA